MSLKYFHFKFILSSCIFIFSCLIAYAQSYIPFPTDTATWTYHTYNSAFNVHDCVNFYMEGDTLINGKSYKKMYGDITNIRYIREDSTKKVYMAFDCPYPCDTIETILYDFNLQLNDTFRVKDYDTSNYYKVVVSNIDSILTNTGYRKRLRIDPLNFDWEISCNEIHYWIEGIGCASQLLYSEFIGGSGNGCEAYSWLNNFQVNNDTMYIDTSFDCSTVGIEDVILKTKNINIFPNPITDVSIFEINNFSVNYNFLEIYNLLGEKVKSINVRGEGKVYLTRKDFNSGCFIYRVVDNKGNYQSGKFIVE